jgi:Xaa-Pro aminopeptidase
MAGLQLFYQKMSRLQQFKDYIEKQGLDGYLIPMADPFQNEFVPDCYRRLEWLTGFTGSAGFLLVSNKESILFVDGRYTIQAEAQVNPKEFSIQNYTFSNILKVLAGHGGKQLGFDPWVLTCREFEAFNKIAKENDLQLNASEKNFVDAVWENKPPLPKKPIIVHPLEYAGMTSEEKREKICKILKEKKIDGVFLSRLDSIAWLLNVRGRDVKHTPVFLSYAYLMDKGHITLFCNKDKIDPAIKLVNVDYKDLGQVISFLDSIEEQNILLDPQKTPHIIHHTLNKTNKIVFEADPCQLPKASTNSAEQKGAKACQIRDGVALTKFLYWIDQHAIEEKADEYTAMEKVLSLRKEQDLFQELSFGTIAAIDQNSVLAHYRTTERTNKKFTDGCVFLCDSGGQYLDGTTDTTRTVWVGKKTPPQELKDNYTRVLKGHIAIATAKFPEGTNGMQLDALARQSLWEVGLDYEHGTGHGVGCYLGVHDGPQGISKRYSSVPLVPGMLLSNEPGYYKKDNYGIRLENVVMVKPAEIKNSDYEMYEFETLTCVPFDSKLINFDLLDEKEKRWLKNYHQWVFEKLNNYLEDVHKSWFLRTIKQ